MSHHYDGSSIDLEKELTRYMLERRVSRRQLLEPIAKLGPAAALAPVIAACTTGASGQTPSPTASAGGVGRGVGGRVGGRECPGRVGRADAGARPRKASCSSTTGPSTSARTSSRRSRRSTASRSRTTSSRTPTRPTPSSATTAAATTSRSRSRSTSRPSSRQGRPAASSTSRCSRTSPTSGTEWAEPGLRPGQRRTRCRTCGGRPASATTPGRITDTLTSSKALWDPRWAKHIAMLDDWQEVFGLALIQLGLRREHDEHRRAGPGARAARAAEAARPRLQHRHRRRR